jgi:hypothetical protein
LKKEISYENPRLFRLLLVATVLMTVPAVYGQDTTTRDKTRDRLNALLNRVGPDASIAFQQSTKSTYVFTGVLKEGLKNADFLEIVINVTPKDTIGFQIFPTTRALTSISTRPEHDPVVTENRSTEQYNFSLWGADDTGDVFTATRSHLNPASRMKRSRLSSQVSRTRSICW